MLEMYVKRDNAYVLLNESICWTQDETKRERKRESEVNVILVFIPFFADYKRLYSWVIYNLK